MDKSEFQSNRAALKGLITMMMNQMNNMFDQLDAASRRIADAQLGGFNEGYAEGYERGYQEGVADAAAKIQELTHQLKEDQYGQTV